MTTGQKYSKLAFLLVASVFLISCSAESDRSQVPSASGDTTTLLEEAHFWMTVSSCLLDSNQEYATAALGKARAGEEETDIAKIEASTNCMEIATAAYKEDDFSKLDEAATYLSDQSYDRYYEHYNRFREKAGLLPVEKPLRDPAPVIVPDETSQVQSDVYPEREAILNVCRIDGGNADYWKTKPVNIWSGPGGRVIATLPSCNDLPLTIIGEDSEYYKIDYSGTTGWIPQSMLAAS